mgnify:CR=1 FL=1
MEQEFEVDFSNDLKLAGSLNGIEFAWDVYQVSDAIFHVIKDNRSYNVEVLEPVEGKTRLKVNGTIYESEVVDKFDELLKSLGMEKAGAGKVNELKAPMPGLVLEIAIKPGDELKKGDRVLVLEAMKMENVIKAPADVTVTSVEVETGKTVDKNQVMVRFS